MMSPSLENGAAKIEAMARNALYIREDRREEWLRSECGSDDGLLKQVHALLAERANETTASIDGTSHDDARGEDSVARRAGFVERLQALGLLSEKEYSDLSSESDEEGSSARELASKLISDGRLTEFQATAILSGGRELRIDRYLIVDELGTGGMGTVFKALHRPMRRLVALKIIAPHLLASPARIERFQREARVVANLDHPNIVRAYDADQWRGVDYLAMEYVRGEDLASLVRRAGAPSVEQATEYVRQAALGLQHAHEAGVVHRDVKPSNLVLSSDGIVKVLDLGLASTIEGASGDLGDGGGEATERLPVVGLTTAGAVLGTRAYISPEQLRDAVTADARSDIFSLGCTYSFLLHGHVPKRLVPIDDPSGTGGEAVSESPFGFLRSDLPPPVREMLLRMIRTEPAERFRSMAEVVEAIEEWQRPGTPAGRSGSASPPAKAGWARSRVGVICLAVAALALLLVENFVLMRKWSLPPAQLNGPQLSADPEEGEPAEPQAAGLRAAERMTSGTHEWSPPETLGPEINQSVGHATPVLTKDERHLWFLRSGNRNKNGVDGIFMASRMTRNSEFRDPQPVAIELPQNMYPREICVSRDELDFVAAVRYSALQTILVEAIRDTSDAPWGKAVPIFAEPFAAGSPVLSADGTELYFASPTMPKAGDILVSTRTAPGEPWSPPTAIRGAVNTGATERPSWLSEDGLLLLLQSDRGGRPLILQQYMSTRPTRDSEWGEPVPVGPTGLATCRGATLSDDGYELIFEGGGTGFGAIDLFSSRLRPKKSPK